MESFSFVLLLLDPLRDWGVGRGDPDRYPLEVALGPGLEGKALLPARPSGANPGAHGTREVNVRLLWFVPELVMLLEWWSGTECVIHTDPQAYPKFGKENAIVVLNHKFEIDFLCGWSLAERFGVLGVSRAPAHPPHSHPALPLVLDRSEFADTSKFLRDEMF